MKIKELRLERSLTKAQLAKELGVNRRTILRWEQDIMCMSLKHALKLADFFEVSIDDLITKEKRGTRKL